MLRDNYICALDISSSKIAAIVARISKRRISELFFEVGPSKGVKKGVVADTIGLVSSVSAVLKSLKASSGINIKTLNVNISGEDISTRHSRAIIPLVERGNKVITPSDVSRVNEQARILGSSLQEEIIHSLPYSYAIDSKANIVNPVGLYSHRLEVDLYLIFAKLSGVQSLARAVNQCGFDIGDIFFSGLATSIAVFDNNPREGVEVLCDIGSDTTDMLVFRNGRLSDVDVIYCGGDDITVKVSDELKIPFELAEEVKRSHAFMGEYSHLAEDKEILVKKQDIYKPIPEKKVIEIAAREGRRLCDAIKDKLERMVPSQRVISFICVGRTVMLDGFLESLENALGIAVRLGRIRNPEIAGLVNRYDSLSGQRYLTYLTSLGLICQSLHCEQAHTLYAIDSPHNIISRAFCKIQEIYQEYF